jgi:hypothetical protein
MGGEDPLGRYIRGEDDVENGAALFRQYLEERYAEDVALAFDEIIKEKLEFHTPVTDEFIYKREQLQKIAQFKRRDRNALVERSIWDYEGPEWRLQPGKSINLPVTRRAIWEQRPSENPFTALTGYYADSWWEEEFDRSTHPQIDIFAPSLLADPRCPIHLQESPELLHEFTPRPIVKFFCDPAFNFDAPHRMIAITPAGLQRPEFLRTLAGHGLTGATSAEVN